MLESVSPLPTLSRGYSVLRKQDGQVITAAEQLAVGESFKVQLAMGSIAATADSIDPEDALSNTVS